MLFLVSKIFSISKKIETVFFLLQVAKVRFINFKIQNFKSQI